VDPDRRQQVTRGQGKHQLVCTQEHGTMVGRALVREATVAKNEKDSRWAPKMSPLDQAAACTASASRTSPSRCGPSATRAPSKPQRPYEVRRDEGRPTSGAW
jgi:hypothetical protein